MKYFIFLACFWHASASAQIALIGPSNRVTEYETQSVKNGNIEKTEELG
jgi:hypothetical protein